MNKIRAAIYVRESSADSNKAPPIQEQIKRAEQYCQEQGYEVMEIFEDNGYSGGNWKRPAWNRLIRLARGHRFQIVIVWNTDRIARDTEQFLFFNRNMNKCHVKVFSLTEGEINLDSVGDSAKNISIAMANELFRKVTSEKVKRAYEMKKRKAKGEPINWGRPKKEHDLEKILKLRSQGLGYRMIAKEFDCSYQTIRRILQNTPQEKKDNHTEESTNYGGVT